MSVLEQIKEKDLLNQLTGAIDQFLAKPDDSVKNEIMETVDKYGIRSKEMMRLISLLQKKEKDTEPPKLNPGLYKPLLEIDKQLDSKPSDQGSQQVVSSDNGQSAEQDQPQLDDVQLTESQERSLKEAMERERARMHRNLIEKERKIRERLMKQAAKRRMRSGPKDSPEVIELKNKKKSLLEQKKVKVAETKQLTAEIKGINEKLAELKGKKKKSTVQEVTETPQTEQPKQDVQESVPSIEQPTQ